MLYENLEPLLGAESIQYLNDEEGKYWRNAIEPCFSFEACEEMIPVFLDVYLRDVLNITPGFIRIFSPEKGL